MSYFDSAARSASASASLRATPVPSARRDPKAIPDPLAKSPVNNSPVPSPPQRRTPPASPPWASPFQIRLLDQKWKPSLTSSIASWPPCNAGAERETGKTDVFGDEPERALVGAVEENVSFSSAKAERLIFRSSGTTRCAAKTDVFGYEPELPPAHPVEENNSTAFIPLSPFLCLYFCESH